jgi:hypothetical protein
MQCVRCGTQLEDGALVCGQCGAIVGASYGSPAAGKATTPKSPVLSSAAGRAKGLVERVKAIMRGPAKEWPVIADEPATAMEIYTGYVAPLAAIGAIALFIGQVTIGSPVPLIGVVRAGIVAGAASAILMFTFTLVWVALLSLIVDAMAPKFGGQSDKVRALKLTAYSQTPALLAGVLHVVPALGFLWVFAALYGVYLAFVGLPVLMRCPKEKALPYAIIMALCAYVLYLLFAGVTTAVTGYGPEFDT